MFVDESGFMLQPVCRRTWAPRGQTPILRQGDRRDRLSAISALTLAPRRRRFGLYWALYPHNIRNAEVLRFLQVLFCGTLLTQWTHGCSALATPDVETPGCRAGWASVALVPQHPLFSTEQP